MDKITTALTTAKPCKNLHTAILVNKHLAYIRAIESYAWSAIVLAQLCTSCFFFFSLFFFFFFFIRPLAINTVSCFLFVCCFSQQKLTGQHWSVQTLQQNIKSKRAIDRVTCVCLSAKFRNEATRSKESQSRFVSWLQCQWRASAIQGTPF